MVLKKTVFIWYQVEITLNHIWLDAPYMIHKTGIKQIKINNGHLKKFTKMNLSFTYFSPFQVNTAFM